MKIAGTLMGKCGESGGVVGKGYKQVSPKNQGISSVFNALPILVCSDIPSLRLVQQQVQRLARDVVPSCVHARGKSSLAIAFIVPTEICKQLQQALLLPRTSDESQQGGIIAKHTMVHVA